MLLPFFVTAIFLTTISMYLRVLTVGSDSDRYQRYCHRWCHAIFVFASLFRKKIKKIFDTHLKWPFSQRSPSRLSRAHIHEDPARKTTTIDTINHQLHDGFNSTTNLILPLRRRTLTSLATFHRSSPLHRRLLHGRGHYHTLSVTSRRSQIHRDHACSQQDFSSYLH